MKRLIIEDLNTFCENDLPKLDQVTGGADYAAIYQTSVSSGNRSGYLAAYSINRRGYSYVLSGQVAGAAAGSIAAAIAVGNASVSVFASTFTSPS